MSSEFLSIWVDYALDPKTRPVRMAGFYRGWTQDGVKNIDCQTTAIKGFISQTERASENQNCIVIL